MPSSKEFATRFPTDEEIQRGIARGRRERALAFSAMSKALLDFLLGRRIKAVSRTVAVVHQTG